MKGVVAASGEDMNLEATEEQRLLREAFSEMLSAESSPERVRAVEAQGFDPALWKTFVELGAIGTRVPTSGGGVGASLLDALVIAEEVGRHLASGPILEAMVTARLLAFLDHSDAREALAGALSGGEVVVLALHPVADGGAQWVPGGAAAQGVVGLDGDDLVLVRRAETEPAPPNLGAAALGRWRIDAEVGNRRIVLASGSKARAAHQAAVEEWKLLMAAALLGLARRALEIGAAYAGERMQFDRLIATFQGVAHPLADAVSAVDAGRHFTRYAVWALGEGLPDAAALISMAYVWGAQSATHSVARALHVHGGYGLSLEYDIQLYHRRAKGWALAAGDPQDELQRVFERRFEGSRPSLPDPGEVTIDFSLGVEGEAFRDRVRSRFEVLFTPEMRNRERLGWEACDFDFQKRLANEGLLFPTWPTEYGGLGCGPLGARAWIEELERVGWPIQSLATTRMVGETLMRFGTEELKSEVLPKIAGGEAICTLGYTEPGSGSDVAAAVTRAVQDGDDWIINGQKMFTSGANLGQYVLLLTRTDPDAPKHRGLTLFLVPLDTPGIEVQPIHTLSDEQSNATYYADVRVPDHFRIGDVNGGWSVIGYALHLEHGGGGGSGFVHAHQQLVEAAYDWARNARRGDGSADADPRVRERIAQAATAVEVVRAFGRTSLWAGTGEEAIPGIGPMLKLLGTETYIQDASSLLDLAAPESLFAEGAEAAICGGEIEYAYRLSTATSIYGGTSEIMRSMVAQVVLGMPRSRS
jgi:alkylation response protein AidB-like acyl-CoA dehydrogenase